MKTTNLFTVTALLTVLGATTAAAEDIRIAVVGPMTGSSAAIGEELRRGAEKAVADLNAAGGVLGKETEPDRRRRCLRSQAGGVGRQ